MGIKALVATAVTGALAAGISFNGDFANLNAWNGGGKQCANYGTSSQPPFVRGTLTLARVAGVNAGIFALPADRQPQFPKEACEIYPPAAPLGLGSDHYYGYMFYVPARFTIGTSSFWGIETAQYHFQNIWGSPIAFQLHNDHMTLALQVGACNNYQTVRPGCAYSSNADDPSGNPGNLGAQYVVPRGSLTPGWHEVIMHVHWAADQTGVIDVFHKLMGRSAWKQTVGLSGIPTVQYDKALGCCAANSIDKVGAYRTAGAAKSVTLAHIIDGSSAAAVAGALP